MLQRYPSWELDEECKWQPPIPYPKDGKDYIWDEKKVTWEKYRSLSSDENPEQDSD